MLVGNNHFFIYLHNNMIEIDLTYINSCFEQIRDKHCGLYSKYQRMKIVLFVLEVLLSFATNCFA